MFRSLTARLTAAYLGLTVALNVLLLILLDYGLSRGRELGADSILRNLVAEATIEELQREALEEEPMDDGFYLRAFDGDGRQLVAEGLRDLPELLAVERLRSEVAPSEVRADTIRLRSGITLRVLTRGFEDGSVVQGGAVLDDETAIRSQLLRYGLGSIVSLAIVAAVIGRWIARSAMRGVNEVTETAQRILDGNLSARVPVGERVQEVAELAQTINQMLDRIDALVADLQDVTANVAHDLRSPITRLRAAAEVALRGEESLEGYRELAERTVGEANQLETILETMLEIVRLDAGVEKAQFETVDLGLVLEQATELYSEALESRQQVLSFRGNHSLTIQGDRTMLQRTIANLLDNAIKFTPVDGLVSIHADQVDGAVRLTIGDSGPGIPPPDLPRVFDRFFRGDTSRGTDGHGLGLSYVQSAMVAHGGSVEIESRVGSGTQVHLSFPASEATSGSPR